MDMITQREVTFHYFFLQNKHTWICACCCNMIDANRIVVTCVTEWQTLQERIDKDCPEQVNWAVRQVQPACLWPRPQTVRHTISSLCSKMLKSACWWRQILSSSKCYIGEECCDVAGWGPDEGCELHGARHLCSPPSYPLLTWLGCQVLMVAYVLPANVDRRQNALKRYGQTNRIYSLMLMVLWPNVGGSLYLHPQEKKKHVIGKSV